jgi:hypothetical protein
MGDPLHVAKLNDGVTTWNTWRQGHSLIIDLTCESFVDRDFTGFDLRFADFGHAKLSCAKFGRGTLAWNANSSTKQIYFKPAFVTPISAALI